MSLLNDYSKGGKFLSDDTSRRKFSNELTDIFKKKGGGSSRERAGKFTDYLKEASNGKGLDAYNLRKAIEKNPDFSYDQKKDLLDIITSDEDSKNN